MTLAPARSAGVGGGMMAFGLLAMLLILAVPVLFVVGLVAAAAGLFVRRPASSAPVNVSGATVSERPQLPATPAARYCAHCGQGLQAGWTHCPYCGAPVSA